MKNRIYFFILAITIAVLSSCSSNTEIVKSEDFIAKQSDLNKANVLYDKNVTGYKYSSKAVAHNGNADASAWDTYRDIYTNWRESQEIKPGTIIAKKIYSRNKDGTKGDFLMAYAMIKRDVGYYPEGGDWEYVIMPFNDQNDYSQNPYGTLPDVGAQTRGKIQVCADCHVNAKEDFVFINDSLIINITQDELNTSIFAYESGITGENQGPDISIAHGGNDLTADETIRDVYINNPDLDNTNAVGTIFTLRTYLKNEQGERSDLLSTFAMIKRENGFDPDHLNWEYILMPFDESNDYNDNPNGKIPSVGDKNRGVIELCWGCHKTAGGADYIFTN